MKKSILHSACTFALSLLIGNGFSQTNAVALNDQSEITDQFLTGSDFASAATKWAPIESVSAKALKEFTKTFKNASDAKWFQDRRIFMTYFNVDGKQAKAAFEKNGYMLYSIISSAEKDLPAEERRLVKSNYVDYNIDVVKQVTTLNKNAWIVVAKKGNNVVLVRLMDQALDELANFTSVPVKKSTKKGRIIIPG